MTMRKTPSTKSCRVCGVLFSVSGFGSGTVVTCSNKCRKENKAIVSRKNSKEYRLKHRAKVLRSLRDWRLRNPVFRVPIPCKTCGFNFAPQFRRVYCSPWCRYAAGKLVQNSKIKCRYCGLFFRSYQHSVSCGSKECTAEWMRQWRRSNRAGRKKYSKSWIKNNQDRHRQGEKIRRDRYTAKRREFGFNATLSLLKILGPESVQRLKKLRALEMQLKEKRSVQNV